MDQITRDLAQIRETVQNRQVATDLSQHVQYVKQAAKKLEKGLQQLETVVRNQQDVGRVLEQVKNVVEQFRAVSKPSPKAKSAELDINLQELREISGWLRHGENVTEETPRGIIKTKELAGTTDIRELSDRISRETNVKEKELLESVREVLRLQNAHLRMRLGEVIKDVGALDVMQDTVEKSDWTRLERLKRWFKDNFLAVSGVAIMAATLITGIIASVRAAGKKCPKV